MDLGGRRKGTELTRNTLLPSWLTEVNPYFWERHGSAQAIELILGFDRLCLCICLLTAVVIVNIAKGLELEIDSFFVSQKNKGRKYLKLKAPCLLTVR